MHCIYFYSNISLQLVFSIHYSNTENSSSIVSDLSNTNSNIKLVLASTSSISLRQHMWQLHVAQMTRKSCFVFSWFLTGNEPVCSCWQQHKSFCHTTQPVSDVKPLSNSFRAWLCCLHFDPVTFTYTILSSKTAQRLYIISNITCSEETVCF